MRNLVSICVFLLLLAPCAARTITVDDDGPADFDNIQAAINDANAGDIVEVKPGTYTGGGNRDIDFLGKAITVRSTDPNDPQIVAATVIDCNGTFEDPHRGFFFYQDEDGNSVLAGVTITNGYVHPLDLWRGGAILCFRTSPKIINCSLKRNTAGEGAGCGCYYGSPEVTNCTFYGNLAYSRGGGIINYYASSEIVNCTFYGNLTYFKGGAIYNFRDSGLTLTKCTFRRNWAGESGGGIYNSGGEPSVTMCLFERNGAGHSGGGMADYKGTPNIAGSTFHGNFAPEGGGAMANEYSTSILINCILSANEGGTYAGGIANEYSSAKLVNCTFAANSAAHGRALGCYYWNQWHPSTLVLTNCILWDGGHEIYNRGNSAITITYSNIEGGLSREGNIEVNPHFALSTDFHLMPGSACIDAGTNTVAGLPTTDLEGNPRTMDGNGDGSSVADMGAYEYCPNSPQIAISNHAFSYVKTRTSSTQTLKISNCGGGTLHWQIVEDCNWLEAWPPNGVSSGEIDSVSLIVDFESPAVGPHNSIMTVIDHNALNSPVTVDVSLYVPRILRVPTEYNTIQAAIDAAKEFDTVVVAPGRYTGDGNRDLDYKGKAITVRSIDPTDPNIVAATIVDCNGTADDPHRGFYFYSGEDAESIIDGLTITSGYAPKFRSFDRPPWPSPVPVPPPGPWAEELSGENTSSEGLVFYESYGGAICCQSKNLLQPGPGPTIRNCIIAGNSTSSDADFSAGAGISGCSGPIVNCTFSNNDWAALAGCHGPITNCTIAGNQGGVFACFGPITNCIISGNRGWGLGYCTSPITNCVIAGNVGTGVFQCSGPIVNCTISHNASTIKGAGVWFQYPYMEPWSTEYVANAEDGFYKSPLIIVNCILWGNEAPLGPQIYLWGGSTFIRYTDIQGGQAGIYVEPQHPGYPETKLYWGAGNMDSDPCFVCPGYWADANDPNLHVEPYDPNAVWLDGDYDLLQFSPCVDTGETVSVPADSIDLDGDGNTTEPIPWDLDGNPRIVDGDYDDNPVVDMGAYEFFWPPIEVSMRLTPQMLNPVSQGRWVKAHFVLPEGFTVEDVDTSTPARITEPFDLECEYMDVFVNESNLVEVEAGFYRAEFCAAAVDGNTVEVSVVGSLTSGQEFYGTDTVKITNNAFKHLADLASYWLEESCDQPDWCGGLDLDQDGALDFVDFALFESCCVEAVEDE